MDMHCVLIWRPLVSSPVQIAPNKTTIGDKYCGVTLSHSRGRLPSLVPRLLLSLHYARKLEGEPGTELRPSVAFQAVVRQEFNH